MPSQQSLHQQQTHPRVLQTNAAEPLSLPVRGATGKDNAPVAFAGFAALLAPVAPPPFVGLGADRRPTASATAMCALLTMAAVQNLCWRNGTGATPSV